MLLLFCRFGECSGGAPMAAEAGCALGVERLGRGASQAPSMDRSCRRSKGAPLGRGTRSHDRHSPHP